MYEPLTELLRHHPAAFPFHRPYDLDQLERLERNRPLRPTELEAMGLGRADRENWQVLDIVAYAWLGLVVCSLVVLFWGGNPDPYITVADLPHGDR